jgi:hypothetical protein
MSGGSRNRAVCVDDGERIVVTVYTGDPPYIGVVEIAPLQAMRLANDLIASALRHIAREARP